MKKILALPVLLTFLAVLCCGFSWSEEIDLSGTWVGTTEVPNSSEANEVTLTLEKADGKYTGTISDSLGMADEEELEDIEFQDNTLSFNFSIFDGYSYIKVSVSLKVEGNKMSGFWETEEGDSAPIELEREI